MSEEIDRVTKLDAAHRQLAAAIELFFYRADPIAVYTLAAAAQEILRDLGRARGIKSVLKDNPLIKPEKQKDVTAIFNAAQNFFKHADRDPDGVLECRPGATPFHIFDAALLYEQLTDVPLPVAHVFRMWFVLKYPNTTVGDLRKLVEEAKSEGIDPENFEVVQIVMEQWKAHVAGP